MSVEPPLDTQNLVQRAVQRQVRLPEYSQPVYIEDAQAIDDLISLTVRTRDGQTDQIIVPAAELAAALDQTLQQQAGSELANPLDFFLLVEAARIRLAYSFDPFFAVSMSGVQALPHQLQAVYERMLPQARLRFLLADDPGAGKTIMAGLLLKELKLRGVINYVLILTPAPLTIHAKTARNLLAQFHHAQIGFGLIVVKRDVKIMHETQNQVVILVQADQQIEGVAFLGCASLARALVGGRIGGH